MKKYNIETYAQTGQEPLGEGRDKVVHVDPDDREKVVAFDKRPEETPTQVKGNFYLTKILHLLYPQHIPDIHMGLSEQDTEQGKVARVVRRRERVEGTESTWRQNDVILDRLFELGVSLDGNPRNYMADGENAQSQYVDTVLTWYRNGSRNYDPEKLKEAILNLDEDKRDMALKYLQRLEELHPVYQEERNKRL